jgi:hypothetical protein
MNCRYLLASMRRGLIPRGLITIAPSILALAILTVVAAPAFAQSSPGFSSSPLTGDYDLPPPEDGSLIGPATADEATPGDTTSSATTSATPSAAVTPIGAADNRSDASAAARSGWDRVGDVYTDTDSDGQPDQVLEVPQALPPATPQPSDGADQTAQEDDSQAPDQVGSIDDYQDEMDDALIGGYGYPVFLGSGISPFGVSAFRTPFSHRFRSGFRPGFQPGFVPAIPRTGGMSSAILSTSPMFPSGAARFSGGGMRFSGFSGGMRFSGGGHR